MASLQSYKRLNKRSLKKRSIIRNTDDYYSNPELGTSNSVTEIPLQTVEDAEICPFAGKTNVHVDSTKENQPSNTHCNIAQEQHNASNTMAAQTFHNIAPPMQLEITT